ncbi:type II toxin-antitoxin system RelB/DinJ family antitoxin [uncultured Catenibacterium sp.]|uniref:type II toxin-antitoxin system RelB/DinJ family antitoxin n=1 Tax=uncultured Catenibacterium sp. TaxID=286142 RepID=UPI0025F7DB22|nr:type II toxin-antitoxin system RelB/DinJ family antitoxin [uncultured Catenibacterium sp.]
MDTDITICMDRDLKEKADALFSELGMDLNTAFNLFVRESLRVGGFPFELRPNKEVIEAMKEAKRTTHDSSIKGYDNLDELFDELKG